MVLCVPTSWFLSFSVFSLPSLSTTPSSRVGSAQNFCHFLGHQVQHHYNSRGGRGMGLAAGCMQIPSPQPGGYREQKTILHIVFQSIIFHTAFMSRSSKSKGRATMFRFYFRVYIAPNNTPQLTKDGRR